MSAPDRDAIRPRVDEIRRLVADPNAERCIFHEAAADLLAALARAEAERDDALKRVDHSMCHEIICNTAHELYPRGWPDVTCNCRGYTESLVQRTEAAESAQARLRQALEAAERTIELLSSPLEVKALIAGVEDIKAGRVTAFAGLPPECHGFAGLPEKDQPK